jgi:purine-binding chemotaxis protein CheW
MSDIRKKAIGTPKHDESSAEIPAAVAPTSGSDSDQNTENAETLAETGNSAGQTASASQRIVINSEARQWVVFQCADVHYALRSEQIRFIEMLGEITPVPYTPQAVAGVFNLRGEIVPVIDLRARLGLPATSYTLAARIIILQAAKRRVGMIVDSAREILRLPDDQIQPPPEMMHGLSGKYLKGIVIQPTRTILILDLDSVLRLEETLTVIEASISSQHEAK